MCLSIQYHSNFSRWENWTSARLKCLLFFHLFNKYFEHLLRVRHWASFGNTEIKKVSRQNFWFLCSLEPCDNWLKSSAGVARQPISFKRLFSSSFFCTHFQAAGNIQCTGTSSKSTLMSSCILLSLGEKCIQINPEKEMTNEFFVSLQHKLPIWLPTENAMPFVWNALFFPT